MFVVLFPTRVTQPFLGFGDAEVGWQPIPTSDAEARMGQVHEIELAVLGRPYLDSRRFVRWPLGRVDFSPPPNPGWPTHADVFLLTHTAGAALWEAWMAAPEQPLDAEVFIAWLSSDVEGSPVAKLQQALSEIDRRLSAQSHLEESFPFTILRTNQLGVELDAVLESQGTDLVRTLYLDRSHLPFKPKLAAEELERDFCLRERGISLLSQRGALDARIGEAFPVASSESTVLAPRSALPLLVAIELLLIERTVLRLFHERLTSGVPGTIAGLLELKAAVLDGLEEYRGTVAASNRFSAEVTAYGERILGIDALYTSLKERLESVTFDITTKYQRTTNMLQFALTVVLGALEASFLAASLASIRYGHNLGPVLAWAAGGGLVAAVVVSLLLWRRLR